MYTCVLCDTGYIKYEQQLVFNFTFKLYMFNYDSLLTFTFLTQRFLI